MGIDFIRRAAATFRKSWDRRRVELCTPDLLTKPIVEVSRVAIAEIIGDCAFQEGDDIIVELSSTAPVATIGTDVVARFDDFPIELEQAVRSAAGVAKGRIERINRLSGTVEVSIS